MIKRSTLLPASTLSVAAAAMALALVGCAGSFSPLPSSSPVSTAEHGQLRGGVRGGQQPIANAHVYVMQAATTGYGAASLSRITTGASGTDSVGSYVLTDSSGFFALDGDYTCTPGTQVYLLALGGNPGAGANVAVGEMALLGACPSAGIYPASTFVSMNEVSTVAAAYSMAGFAVDATHVASSATALAATGMANAFATAGNLVDLATGVALATTPAGNGTAPQTEMNTLGDILASCINGNGSTSSGQPCAILFANATADGTSSGANPTETATAAINIAHHPTENPTALYSLQTATPPFSPTLAAAPNDFTVQLYFAGAGQNDFTQVAIDGSGNVWFPDQGDNTLKELSPLGVVLSGTGFSGGGINGPYGVAIDASGYVWVASVGGAVTKFNAAGVSQSGTTGFTGNGDLSPYQIAIDKGGNAWVTNLYNASVSELSSAGSELLNSNTTNPNVFSQPTGIGIDANNNVQIADLGKDIVVVENQSGTTVSSTASTYGGHFLSVTAANNAWVTDFNNEISLETATTHTDYTGAGLSNSQSTVLDGAGNVWVTNYYSGTISEFNSAGVAVVPNGIATTIARGFGIGVDGSGNVWASDFVSGSITEIVGAAVPTVTPLVQAVIDNNIAGRP